MLYHSPCFMPSSLSSLIFIASAFCFVVQSLALDIPLYVQKPNLHQKLQLGILTQNIDTSNGLPISQFTSLNHNIPPGLYCVGADTKDKRHSCFSYIAVCYTLLCSNLSANELLTYQTRLTLQSHTTL